MQVICAPISRSGTSLSVPLLSACSTVPVLNWQPILHYPREDLMLGSVLISCVISHARVVEVENYQGGTETGAEWVCSGNGFTALRFRGRFDGIDPDAKVICTTDRWHRAEPVVRSSHMSFLGFAFCWLPTLRFFATFVRGSMGRYGDYLDNARTVCRRRMSIIWIIWKVWSRRRS